jgi:hypothetical protein
MAPESGIIPELFRAVGGSRGNGPRGKKRNNFKKTKEFEKNKQNRKARKYEKNAKIGKNGDKPKKNVFGREIMFAALTYVHKYC